MYFGAAVPVVTSDESKSIAIAGEVTVYTKSFPLAFGTFFGIWVRATSDTGTPNVKIELEESYALPTTEGSAGTTLWVEPDGFDDIFSAINDELAHVKTIAPVPMNYGRYKITGLTGNPADTVVTILNFIQEHV